MSRITATRQKALYVMNTQDTDASGDPIHVTYFRNTTVSHECSTVQPGDFQSVVAGASFENVRFKESLSTGYYIAVQWAKVGNDVVVDGPQCTFSGRTGTIAPGIYKIWVQFNHDGQVVTAPFAIEVD